MFAALSVSPLVFAAVLFKSLLERRRHEILTAESAATDEAEALKLAQQIISGGSSCLCLASSGDQSPLVSLRVEPHLPETRVLRLPTEEVVGGITNNPLTNLFAGERSRFSLSLNFIHFALSSSSDLLPAIAAGRPISLLYVDPTSGDSVVLSGLVAIVDAPAYKSHYWRSSWGAYLPGGPSDADYKLVKFVPSSISIDLDARGPAKWQPIKLRRVITEDSIFWAFDK